jgi:uncharacterized membrane protein
MRAVPDVAMTAAGHDGYIIEENGSYWVIAGTSAASPTFTGVMALVVQAQGGKGQGNANPGLYALLNAAKNPFHSTLSGNNSVPGVSGFTASGGAYNLATGLGSVDGALLVSSWGKGAGAPAGINFVLAQSAASGTVVVGKTATFTIAVTESGATKNAVALTAKTPAGVTASISPASILPGTAATVTLTVGSTATAGAQSITVTGSNSSGTQTLTFGLTVTVPVPPTLTLTAASASASAAQGNTVTDRFTLTGNATFTGSVSLSVSGLPTGVTAAWSSSPVTLAAESGTSTLTLTAASTATVASATITVTANGDGVTATKQITLQVTQPPGLQLALSASTLSMTHIGKGSITVYMTELGGLDVPTTLSLSGLPLGLTPALSQVVSGASGSETAVLTFSGSAAAKAGKSTLTITVTGVSNGATFKATQPLSLQLN